MTRHVVVSACVCAVVLGAGCRDSGSLTQVSALIDVPASVEFGEVLLGATKTLPVKVTNRGSGALEICIAGDEHAALGRVEKARNER